MTDPADLLRPISKAAKLAAAPIIQNARDHAHYQHLLLQHLAPISRIFEEPLRLIKASSPYVGRAAADELSVVAIELSQLADSMAGPSWWTKVVFWKVADCRPVFKKFSADLTAAASAVKSAQPQFQQWAASRPHPQYIGDLDPQTLKEANKLQAEAQRLDALEHELNGLLEAARTSREIADKFFHAWIRGKGFVAKPKRQKST